MRHKGFVIAGISLGLIVSSSLEAQQPKTGQIIGHVIDQVGATIKEANVFVRRNIPSDDDVRLVANADIHGDFRVTLPEGGYDILVTASGLAASVKTIPILSVRQRKLSGS